MLTNFVNMLVNLVKKHLPLFFIICAVIIAVIVSWLIFSSFMEEKEVNVCHARIDSLMVIIRIESKQIDMLTNRANGLAERAQFYKTNFNAADRRAIEFAGKYDSVEVLLIKVKENRDYLESKLNEALAINKSVHNEANEAKYLAELFKKRADSSDTVIARLSDTLSDIKPELSNFSKIRKAVSPLCYVLVAGIATPDAMLMREKILPYLPTLTSSDISTIYDVRNSKFREIAYKYHMEVESFYLASRCLGYPPAGICQDQAKAFIQSALQSDLRMWSGLFGCDSAVVCRVITTLKEVYKNP